MKLNKFIKKLNIKANIINNHKINSIEDNSKNCKLNDIFFAIESSSNDFNSYIANAISNGAKTIVYDKTPNVFYDYINYIKVYDIKKIIALSAKIYYKDITKKIKLIGITGTNGKTSISNIIFKYLLFKDKNTMLIGTNGIFINNKHIKTLNTTPDLLLTTKLIKENKIDYVVMEVSSIGIRELKVMYFDFDVIILSNVTHDHLDYHKTIIDYKFSKSIIMSNMQPNKNKVIILNKDLDDFSFYNKLCNAKVVTYSLNNVSDYKAININKYIDKTSFTLVNDDFSYNINTSLIGEFNIYNILSAISCIHHFKFCIKDFSLFLESYLSVEGRMQTIKYNNRLILIDYAHTPDGVDNVLKTLKQYTNKLTVVIGAGGNRDKEKRAIIGMVIQKYTNNIILTNDNPRFENELDIINDITKEINNYKIIINRKDAIYYALNNSIENEIIAILGKGSEEYQEINGVKYSFNDKQVVDSYIKEHTNE